MKSGKLPEFLKQRDLLKIESPGIAVIGNSCIRAHAGLAGKSILRFTDSAAAADAIEALVRPGDLILIKGSRGTRTDIVADRLKGRA